MGGLESGHRPLREAKIKSVLDRSVGHNRPALRQRPIELKAARIARWTLPGPVPMTQSSFSGDRDRDRAHTVPPAEGRIERAERHRPSRSG
jgi:hypothetical protein